MKTDSIFYELFQGMPSLLLEVSGRSPDRTKSYEFRSVEIKQTAFRIDGVLLPRGRIKGATVFTEVQFQPDDQLHHRFFAEVFLYLKQYPKTHDWQGVLIYRSRKLEQPRSGLYDLLLDSAKVTRIYLDELGDVEDLPIGLALLRLIVEPTKTAPQKARKLVERVQKEPMVGVNSGETISSIATIMVYMFTHLSRKEVDKMIGLTTKFQDTKVYQEAKEEGRMAERVEGIVSILADRFGAVPTSILNRLNAIADAKSLKELLLRSASVSSLSDFERLLK